MITNKKAEISPQGYLAKDQNTDYTYLAASSLHFFNIDRETPYVLF